MSIDPGRVEEIYRGCLAEDLTEDGPDYLVVEGIIHSTAFDKRKLETHRDEVAEMLSWLPTPYRPPTVEINGEKGGGGWSFLNACFDKDEFQWTGLHRTMDMLFQVAIGLDLAAWLMPRDMWPAFPGGMPYVSVTLPGDRVGV